jgi:site-specific DNA recombinase
MIAAIYARKSTEQNGVGDDEKSVTRQIEHAKAYAVRKGWTVDDAHVYSDDGISGAEFKKRPGLLRLLTSVAPRPSFKVLVMSEESRLGREAIETGYVLKQIMDAGVRVFFYLEDRERTLDTAMDKVMLSLTNFASEMEREKSRQRTYDAMVRKARALHVTGGKVYGYDNVDVPSPEDNGTRLRVVRQINEEQAATIRHVFELYASGIGMTTIAHRLNQEGVKPPRGRGWAPSGIREMLHRELYRGEVVWNRSQKIIRAGTKKQRKRDESEWIRIEAPDLRVISDDLWQRVKATLDTRAAIFPRGSDRKLLGRPRYKDESSYLLVGFARCSTCGGPIGTDLRGWGSPGARRSVPHYACLDSKRRGKAICINRVALRQDLLDGAILSAIGGVLDPAVLSQAVEKALARLAKRQQAVIERRTEVERELAQVQLRLDRLIDALADGSLPADEIKARLSAEKARKTVLSANREKLGRVAGIASMQVEQITGRLRSRIADVAGLLSKQTVQARQMLRKVLADKIDLEPVGFGKQRGYKFRGALSLERLIEGVAMNNTSDCGGPNGIRWLLHRGSSRSCSSSLRRAHETFAALRGSISSKLSRGRDPTAGACATPGPAYLQSAGLL